jgi:hypothetical protein
MCCTNNLEQQYNFIAATDLCSSLVNVIFIQALKP